MSHATPPSTNLTSNDSMSTHPSQLEMTEHTIQQSQVVFHVEDGETDETMPASTSEGYVSFSPDPLKALSLTDITASPASPVSADEVHGLLKELSVNDEQKSPDGEEVKLNPALAVTTMSIAQLEKHTESQFNFNDLKQSPGISSAEAAKRLLRDGRNALTPPPQRPEIVKYLLQYTDPFMLLLLGAGILTFIAYALDTSQILNLWIGVVLEVAVFLSASFSYITERRAGDAMSAFKKMLPANASVIRDGKRSKIPAVELVVGDIVFVGTGDQVPADMRILASTNMKVEKSSLTGESLPISVGAKCDRSITKIEDAPNIIFNTTQCMEGECIAVVVHTGDRTLIGSIAGMVTNISHKMTPVQKEIHHFVKRLSILAGVLGLIFFIIGLARGKSPIPCFISSFVVVCIACVPEGLPLTALACLSVTAKRMAKKQVFIKQLSSVETLGSVTAIASDKTGTLTQNKMTVVHMWFDQFSMSSSGIQSSFPVHLPSLVTSQNGVGTKAPAVSIGDSAATYNVLELAAVLCNRAKYSDEQPLSDSEATMLERAQLLQGMDPTGSMTMNRLRGNFPTLLGSMEQNLDLSAALKLYTKLGVTASSSSLSEETGVARTVTGDATDSALLQFVATRQSVELLRYHYRTVFEVPFNSRNKYALTIVKPVHVKSHLPSSPSSSDEKPSTTTTGKKALQEAEGRPAGERESSTRLLFLKGAPEVVLSKCSNYLFRGETKPIDGGFRNQFNQAYETFGSRGERVLGFAYLELDPETYSPAYDGLYASELNNFPTEKLTFVGLIALVDPPKPSVPRAVQLCRQAGVKVLMVTGDHALTAAAIARQVNILTQPTAAMLADSMGCLESEVPDSNVQAVVVVGSDLINFTEQDWNRILSKEEVVFARTTPAQKLLIVENLQRLNHLVAVTGDGVNDSPALKRADIGVAMGLMGSDVARDAADVILMDDVSHNPAHERLSELALT